MIFGLLVASKVLKLFMMWNLVNPLFSLYWVEALQRATMEQGAEERVKSK
jgi:hypothetical protein